MNNNKNKSIKLIFQFIYISNLITQNFEQVFLFINYNK